MADTVAAAELLEWRRTQLQAGGQASQLDWLLDLEGGIRWQTLQQLRLYPDRTVPLTAPLTRLAQLWHATHATEVIGAEIRRHGVVHTDDMMDSLGRDPAYADWSHGFGFAPLRW